MGHASCELVSGEPLVDSRKNRPGFPWHLLVVFLLLAAGIAAVGWFYYHGYEQLHRAEVDRQLLAIAELKTDELVDWRRERLGDAAVFFKNAAFSALVRRHFNKPDDAEAQRQLRSWLGQFQAGFSYGRVFLLDARGVSRMQVPDAPEPLAPHLPRNAAETLRCGKITFLDFHRDAPNSPVYLAILIPILDEQDGNRPLGVLALRIDPAVYLYPFICRWPTPSPTAETLLVRRDGDDAVFLSELRFQKDTALTLRVPLTKKEMPSVMAALGQEGIVEGVDYQGVPVIAALRAVPDSPWFLVARMDASEAYAPVRERLWIVIALVGALLLGAGAALGVVWRHQSAVFYREKAAAADALRENERLLIQKNDELTRFTYTVSHDLKSPLVTITTFLGYLEKDIPGRDAARMEKDLAYIRTAANRMGRLLDELLELSRIGHKMNPSVEAPLQTIVKEALGLVAGQIAQRGVKVQVTEEPVLLYGDRERLVEVFQNLVDNAVKFMGDQPAPCIKIGVEQPDGETVIFVQDNGIGIDPRHKSKLFSLFEKLNPSTEGTGIGLAVVRRVVEVHGGRTWAESAGPGKGATFRFTLAGTKAQLR
jgi:signal transduction histidine kinase